MVRISFKNFNDFLSFKFHIRHVEWVNLFQQRLMSNTSVVEKPWWISKGFHFWSSSYNIEWDEGKNF